MEQLGAKKGQEIGKQKDGTGGSTDFHQLQKSEGVESENGWRREDKWRGLLF